MIETCLLKARIQPHQIGPHHPSYINAILIMVTIQASVPSLNVAGQPVTLAGHATILKLKGLVSL
jgi:hypothetical protein